MEQWREELYHFGLKGMKWGHRRWQNPDGTFNEAGKKRYFGTSSEGKERLKKGAKTAAGIAVGAGAAAGAVAGVAAAKKSGVKAQDVFDQNIKIGKDKPNVSPAERIASKTGETIGRVGDVYNKHQEIKYKSEHGSKVTIYDDYVKGKSDAQLKKEINRMADEIRWNELNSKQVAAGKVTINDYMEQAKNITMIAAGAATVIGTIYKIKHP